MDPVIFSAVNTNDNKSKSKKQIRRQIKQTRKTLKRQKKQEKSLETQQLEHTSWALSFTKRLIIVIVTFFILATIYSGAVMWVSQSFEFLGQIYDDIVRLVEISVFGYLIKAGFENLPKIIGSQKRLNNLAASQSVEEPEDAYESQVEVDEIEQSWPEQDTFEQYTSAE